jgi:predicted  nucleic acid-binding Zn ribbon protein
MELFEKLKNDSRFADHIYGRDYKFIPNKLDGLKDYMFSIVVENSIYPKYYTEKITDCFATGTVPIYYGDKSIGEDFNSKV